MDDLILAIIAGIISVGIITAFIVLGIMEIRKIKKTAKNGILQKSDEHKTEKMHVTVIDKLCSEAHIGRKAQKSVKSFSILFVDGEGKILSLPISEEYYEAFEKEQSGVLTLIDGDFFTFEIDN